MLGLVLLLVAVRCFVVGWLVTDYVRLRVLTFVGLFVLV